MVRQSGLCEQGVSGAGCHNLTVSRAQRALASSDSTQEYYSMDLAEAVDTEYKLELACTGDLADSLVDAIAKAGHTGQPQAGWTFLSDIQPAVEIR